MARLCTFVAPTALPSSRRAATAFPDRVAPCAVAGRPTTRLRRSRSNLHLDWIPVTATPSSASAPVSPAPAAPAPAAGASAAERWAQEMSALSTNGPNAPPAPTKTAVLLTNAQQAYFDRISRITSHLEAPVEPAAPEQDVFTSQAVYTPAYTAAPKPGASRVATPGVDASASRQSQYAARLQRLSRVVSGEVAPAEDVLGAAVGASPAVRTPVSAAQARWSRLSDHARGIGRADLDEKTEVLEETREERRKTVVDIAVGAFADAGKVAEKKGAQESAGAADGVKKFRAEAGTHGNVSGIAAASTVPVSTSGRGDGVSASAAPARGAPAGQKVVFGSTGETVNSRPDPSSAELLEDSKRQAQQARQRNADTIIADNLAKRSKTLQESSDGVFEEPDATSEEPEKALAGAGFSSSSSFSGATSQGMGPMAIATAGSGALGRSGAGAVDDAESAHHTQQTFVSTAILAVFMALCIICGERFAELLQFATSNNGMFL